MLTGLTGVGKTERLAALAAAGEQVLDLERMASHRGSAFGGIGLPPQPRPRAFARAVEAAWAAADPGRVLWVEDEGPFIGSVPVPAALQAAIASAPVVELRASPAERLARLEALYRHAPAAALIGALERSARRLGAARTARAAALIERDQRAAAIAVVLPYFDAAYRHRMRETPRPAYAGAVPKLAAPQVRPTDRVVTTNAPPWI